MIYILVIWTVVGHGGMNRTTTTQFGWRPIGEFHAEHPSNGFQTGKTALQMCEDAASQLGLKSETFRCVRSK